MSIPIAELTFSGYTLHASDNLRKNKKLNLLKKLPPPYWWISLQCLLALFLVSVCWVVFDRKTAFAALVGGLISCISNLIFATCFFSAQGAVRKSKKILSRFYAGEGLKLIFTTALFAISILYVQLPFLPLLVSYLIVHLSLGFIGLIN